MLIAGGGRRARRFSTSSSRRRAGPTTARRQSSKGSTCPSATPTRSSTSGRPPAASTGLPPGCARRPAGGARCRSSSSRCPPLGSLAMASPLNAEQAYVAEILTALLTSTPEVAALWAPNGRVLREGEVIRDPELAEALVRLGQRRRGALLPGRHRRCRLCTGCGSAAARSRAATSPATQPSSASPSSSPTATAGSSPTRPPRQGARCSPMRSRCSIAGPRRLRCGGSWTRWRPPRPSALPVRRRARRGRLPRALPVPAARLHHAHVGDRRRGLCMQRHLHQRRGLRGRGAGHRPAPEQRDGRGGPQSARLAPVTPPAGGRRA